MNEIIWMVYITTGFFIIFPLLQIGLFKVDKKYKSFLYVTISLFIWWIVDFLRLVSTNPTLIYYLSLLVYPIVYLVVFTLFEASIRYLRKPLNKYIILGLVAFFFVNLFISMTNNLHFLVLDFPLSDSVTYEAFKDVSLGPFFAIHMGVTYILLLGSVASLIYKLLIRLKETGDAIPLILIVLSVIFGFFFNILQVFFFTFDIDPTMVAATAFLSVLYYVFYMRDLRLILAVDRNNFLISNLRERYVIVNEKGIVIDASKEFISMTGIQIDEDITYDDLIVKLQEKAILFENADDVKYDFEQNKLYLKTYHKDIRLPVYKKRGSFHLFHDETSNLKYINDMNYVKTHDLMTRLFNRNYIEDIRDGLDQTEHIYHIIMFDLDGLKLFNDILGHEKGDDLLIRFSNQLLTVTNEGGIVAIRLGGDEFVILAINKTDDRVNDIVENLRLINEELGFIDTIHYSYAISNNEGKETMGEVLAEADQNMYKMKQNKSNYKEVLKLALNKIAAK